MEIGRCQRGGVRSAWSCDEREHNLGRKYGVLEKRIKGRSTIEDKGYAIQQTLGANQNQRRDASSGQEKV